MNKKFLLQLILVAFVAAAVSFLSNGLSVQANLFKDFIDRYIPFLQQEFPRQESPRQESPKEKEKQAETPAPQDKTPSYESAGAHEQMIIKAVEEASPSAVSIVISKDLPVIEQCPYDQFGDLPPEIQQFFGDLGTGFTRPCQKGTKKQEVGGGTGFVISGDGLILTNKHVVSDEKAEYTVLTNDGKKYNAKILARDPMQDLAIVKIEATGLKPLKLGNSDAIKLGQTAIAIGNALGEFRNTVSIGVISGLARKVTASNGRGSAETLEGLIQTDAAINPGNSGGPLLNLKGEAVGINVAMASGAQSIGFAIPINKAKRDISSVKASGRILIPFLGVRYFLINEKLAKEEKLSVNYGALVRGNEDGPGVVKDGPAAKAGIQTEDIILEINGQKINENNSLGFLVQKYNVGNKVKLKILRDGKEMELEAILEERKG